MNKSIFPNLFTGANLGFGVLGITFSAKGQFEVAAICVLLSLLADGLDGRVARALGVSGPFGRELDSLADVVGFGVAPAFMLYSRQLAMADFGGYSWIGYVPLIVFAVLGGFRLARFNIMTEEVHGYFQGLPIPAAGCLAATYVLSEIRVSPEVLGILMIVVGYLLVSEVHYPDFKGKSADNVQPLIMGLMGVVGVWLLQWNWHSIIVLPFALYVLFGIFNTLMNQYKK